VVRVSEHKPNALACKNKNTHKKKTIIKKQLKKHTQQEQKEES